MRYDERTIESIKEANDIVDVIGSHVRLTKKGGTYFGLCPFHSEKTASFSVNQRKQFYYCFGCGEGGDVISFLMKYDSLTFMESVRSLADRANISLPEPQYSAEETRDNDLKKKLFEVNKEAAYFYVKNLYTPEGLSGYRYFTEQRGLSRDDIRHFGLGYAPGGSGGLYRLLKDKGYADDVLKESGLFVYNGSRVRDKFYNRVMFPIMDVNNRVRGFGGRVMGDGEPKYLNSPETLIFSKSELLYGLNFAKRSREKCLLLCEGYMDVIALQKAGFINSVASLGTAFNEKHARLLKRYTDNVVLAQDSDEAGTRAKLKAYPILKAAGLNVRVLEISGAKDPDEFIRKFGASAYEDCIKKARNAFLYMIETRKREYDLADPAGRTDFYNEVAESLLMFGEPLERSNYIDAVSREFMIDRDSLKAIVDRKINERGFGFTGGAGNGGGLGGSAGVGTGGGRWPDGGAGADAGRGRRSGGGAGADAGGGRRSGGAGTMSRNGKARAEGFQDIEYYPDGNGAVLRDYGDSEDMYASDELYGGEAYGQEAYGGEDYRRDADGAEYDPRMLARQKEVRGTTRRPAAVPEYEKLLISWLLEKPDMAGAVFECIRPEYFETGVYRDIASQIAEGKIPDSGRLMTDYMDDGEARSIIAATLAQAEKKSVASYSGPELEKGVTEAVRSMMTAYIDRRISEVTAAGDLKEMGRLLKEKNALRRLRVEL